jgi:hypothetical protein
LSKLSFYSPFTQFVYPMPHITAPEVAEHLLPQLHTLRHELSSGFLLAEFSPARLSHYMLLVFEADRHARAATTPHELSEQLSLELEGTPSPFAAMRPWLQAKNLRYAELMTEVGAAPAGELATEAAYLVFAYLTSRSGAY